MPTDAEQTTWWDDELDQLTKEAVALSSEDVVGGAFTRAVSRLMRNHLVMRGRSAAVAPLSASDFKGAMKAELRRLVTRH